MSALRGLQTKGLRACAPSREESAGFPESQYSGLYLLEITATLLLRFVPAEGTESVGANDLGADTIEVSGKRGVRAALLKINKD